MKLVKPSIKFLNCTENPLKAIEIAGRTCYKSEDLITDNSAEKFVAMLLKRGHEAMIEHSNFILSVDPCLYSDILQIEDRQYIRMSSDIHGNGCLISGNPRALRDFCLRPDIDSIIQRPIAVELSKHTPILFDDTVRYTDHLSEIDSKIGVELFTHIDNLSIPEKLKHQVASYKFICNRGFTHENVRHRPFSYAQESTRYCNYKGGVSFIIPCWFGENWSYAKRVESSPEHKWCEAMSDSEYRYLQLLKYRWKPQQVRGVLPIDVKTEIVVTGNLQQWRIFFGLRCTPQGIPDEKKINGIYYGAPAPHPQMQEIANMALKDIQKRVPGIFDNLG